MLSTTKTARNKRKKRVQYDYPHRRWTAEEQQELLGFLDLIGHQWMLIARYMQRSPDSLRGCVARMEANREAALRKRAEKIQAEAAAPPQAGPQSHEPALDCT